MHNDKFVKIFQIILVLFTHGMHFKLHLPGATPIYQFVGIRHSHYIFTYLQMMKNVSTNFRNYENAIKT